MSFLVKQRKASTPVFLLFYQKSVKGTPFHYSYKIINLRSSMRVLIEISVAKRGRIHKQLSHHRITVTFTWSFSFFLYLRIEIKDTKSHKLCQCSVNAELPCWFFPVDDKARGQSVQNQQIKQKKKKNQTMPVISITSVISLVQNNFMSLPD